MRESTEIDETFNLYEKRYELTKLARESGIDDEEFNKLDSKEKFLLLSNKLKEGNRTHLAAFFFGKLFEISQDLNALLHKIDCLIELGELEEAFRFNCIGFELFLEDPAVDPDEVEKKLFYSKALITFCNEKYYLSEWLCEEGIIRFSQVRFYYLLCAVFVALSKFSDAKKFFTKYSRKFENPLDFLTEVFIHLVNVNQLEKAIEFLDHIKGVSNDQKVSIINSVNNYYTSNKNKKVLRNFFDAELFKVTN